jgi:hypothetical protein
MQNFDGETSGKVVTRMIDEIKRIISFRNRLSVSQLFSA